MRRLLLALVFVPMTAPVYAETNCVGESRKNTIQTCVAEGEYTFISSKRIASKDARRLHETFESKNYDDVLRELATINIGNDLTYYMLGEVAQQRGWYLAALHYFSTSSKLASGSTNEAYCGYRENAGRSPRGVCKNYNVTKNSARKINQLEKVLVVVDSNFQGVQLRVGLRGSTRLSKIKNNPPVGLRLLRDEYVVKGTLYGVEAEATIDLREVAPQRQAQLLLDFPVDDVHRSMLKKVQTKLFSAKNGMVNSNLNIDELAAAEALSGEAAELLATYNEDDHNEKIEENESYAKWLWAELADVQSHGKERGDEFSSAEGLSIADYLSVRENLSEYAENSQWVSVPPAVLWVGSHEGGALQNDIGACRVGLRVNNSIGLSCQGARYAIGARIRPNESKRHVRSRETSTSEYVADIRPLYNPEYDTARAAVDTAYMNYMDAVRSKNDLERQCSTGTNSVACAAAGLASIGINNRKKQYQRAQSNAAATPQMINTPFHQPYEFSIIKLLVERSTPVDVVVVESDNRKTYKGTLSIDVGRTFTIHSGLLENDRYKKKSPDSESDIERYLKRTPDLRLSNLLEEITKISKPERYSGDSDSMAEYMAPSFAKLDSQSVLLKAQGTQAQAVQLVVDRRSKSIVVIENSTGDRGGTGFYVAENVLVTNEHVIEGLESIFVRTSSGESVSVTVLARDPVRDLVALRIARAGIPLKLNDSDRLTIGTTVEAIGHPGSGVDYTLTRGTLSQLQRRAPYKPEFSWAKVLYIQTDAALNKGNSGGPLFIGDEVVGVNTWKPVEVDVEGIAYAIHVSELVSFLKAQDLMD